MFVWLLGGSQLFGVDTLTVGVKSFTESELLGQMALLLARDSALDARLIELHGTQLVWTALKSGDVHLYPEYTGTLREEVFAGESLPDDEAIRRRLAALGLEMTEPLGFNNTYALGMKEELAQRLGIRRISDLKQHSSLKFGWPGLRRRYGLSGRQVTGLEHGLAYRAVDVGDIDITDIYSTDPNIRHYGFRVLEDDLGHFPKYNALFLFRRELAEENPEFIAKLRRLEGQLDEQRMRSLNERVELDGVSPARVAAEFLSEALQVQVEVKDQSMASRIAERTLEHVWLVALALGAAILISVPLGIVAAKFPLAGQLILGVVEVIQTIPGLALLVFIGALFLTGGLPMIGAAPVIAALFLYSLLPIIRNTAAGIGSVPAGLHESAMALGLPPLARLRLIELPMASQTIFAGIKTAAVISVGYAALGGLIGAGGYGQPIMTGLRLNSLPLMLEGAVPAALLALVVKGIFEFCEHRLVPLGLRRRRH
jgi:osmoprotectant transport system permease protein